MGASHQDCQPEQTRRVRHDAAVLFVPCAYIPLPRLSIGWSTRLFYRGLSFNVNPADVVSGEGLVTAPKFYGDKLSVLVDVAVSINMITTQCTALWLH